MKLKRFEVSGLLGKEGDVRLVFHDDLNIITGRNGSGKTSVLKLLWYIMSGNILLALREVAFKRVMLQTTDYTCTIHRTGSATCRIDWHDEGGSYLFEDEADSDGDVFTNAEDYADARLRERGSSVFLPTFRRIEGGFTLGQRASVNPFGGSKAKGEIDEVLITLSKKLSHDRHVFVAALSTTDVVTLLVQKYTDLSEQYNAVQQKTSQGIIEKIKAFRSEQAEGEAVQPSQVLAEIQTEIEGMEAERGRIMTPLEAVQSLVMRLLKHAGIKVGRLSFGDAANAINSDALSAGEKQLLSFIAYNAFYSNAVVLIDEPELSLHVDWQRQLFPILLAQQATNQFFIATHSPFIYSKYPDKELQIDAQRGDEGGEESA